MAVIVASAKAARASEGFARAGQSNHVARCKEADGSQQQAGQ